jgi:hypothetical protein
MSRPGFAYEGYRWENGWPAERNVLPETSKAEDVTDTPGRMDNVEEANVERTMDTAQVYPIQTHNPSTNQASESASSTAGYSQVSDAEESDDDDQQEPGQVILGGAYAQCKAAREAANRRIVVDISCNENAMVSSTLGGDRVGSMDKGVDKSIENCFKGARIEKNGVLVNQYLSCSFDPSTLVCITCESEHRLLEGGEGTDCYCLTDQNFIATLPGSESKDCLKIIRIENASLIELANIFLEILEGKLVKPGTCVLVSSLSYLAKVGAAAYAAEWRVCVNMLTCKWAGILVCPVFPIHSSSIPGNLFGELLILHTWFRKVYAGTNQGLSSSWDKYAELLLEFSEGAGSLEQPELRTPLLPSSLDPAASFEVFHFSTSSTCPAVIFGFDRKAIHELLLSLSTSLRRGFSFAANPEAILVRDPPAQPEGAKEAAKVLTIILAGASNLGSLKPIFEANGAIVIDLTKPGWMVTESNIESLQKELNAFADSEDTAVIFDLFGNSAYKFKHVDGSLVLPFKVGGGYHFLGEIHLDTDRKIGELIDSVKPLLLTCKNLLMVVNPPLPRHVFTPCCSDKGHATNLGEEGFRSSFLESILHFRKILKTSLVGLEGLGRFWVTDTLGCVGNIPPTTTEKLAALKPVLGKDGVHLTDQGRFNFFNTLAKAVLGLRNGTLGGPPKSAVAAALPLVSGKKFFWRGFTSDRGSVVRPVGRPGRGRGSSSRGVPGGGRGRGSRPSPYARVDQSASRGRGNGRGGY